MKWTLLPIDLKIMILSLEIIVDNNPKKTGLGINDKCYSK